MKYLCMALVCLILLGCKKEPESEHKTRMETISYINRSNGKTETENVPSEGVLKWLYSSTTGKAALHLLFKRKVVTALGGWYMDSSLSAKRVRSFVEEHNINLSEYQISDVTQYKTFNQFFYRKLKEGVRPIREHVVSPADGKILTFQSINDVSSFFIKGSEFSLQNFLQDEPLTKKYSSGAMAIIRLAPVDYHRYHFPASGIASASTKIKGHYFSVSPLALLGSLHIFCENKREYCSLKTEQYGDVLIMDVGATMVGGITQTYKANSEVKKGQEKGFFSFGGSTLVLLFEKDKIQFDQDLIKNTKEGLETYIQMGENIAR